MIDAFHRTKALGRVGGIEQPLAEGERNEAIRRAMGHEHGAQAFLDLRQVIELACVPAIGPA